MCDVAFTTHFNNKLSFNKYRMIGSVVRKRGLFC